MRKLLLKIQKIKPLSQRTEIFFYYSGHSDEEGILLGYEKVYYKEIKRALEKMPVDVRIAILDSCSSGAFTRIKGGKMRSPFLLDTSYNMKGSVIMTSSSSDEVSQESDRIKASFFTHYLISGLRGAADMTRDGRISLNEAYLFAYRQTLARTEKTLGGAQHPNYSIQMTGTGDLIMTDIRKSLSRLVISKNLFGKFFINNSDNIPVAEFNKPYGSNVEIALERGKYNVVNERNRKLFEAYINVTKKRVYLNKNNFAGIQKEKTTLRGKKANEVVTGSNAESNKKSILIEHSQLKFGGFGGPIIRFSQVGNNFGLFVGGQGGVIINDHFVIGAGGFGLVNEITQKDISGVALTGEQLFVSMGYGGPIFLFYFFPKKLFHFSLGVLLGAGGIDLSPKDAYNRNNNEIKLTDSFLVIEPELNIFINMTAFLRIGLGLSYRYINGIHTENFSNQDFSDFSTSIIFAFGWF